MPNSYLLLPKWHSHISSIMCLHSQINIPEVGNVYSLEQVTEALQEVAAGQKSGKVIIKPQLVKPQKSSIGKRQNRPDFVKKVHAKSEEVCFALQKCLFWAAIQALLLRKTGPFTMQNNGYCKALIMKLLCGLVLPAKSLHFYSKILHHVLHCNET